MRIRWLLLFTLAVALLGSAGVSRQTEAAPVAPSVTPAAAICDLYPQASGATWKICFPSTAWNTQVVVWAHGYEPPGFAPTYQDALPDGTSLPELVTNLGMAFITSTYPSNGLVVTQARTDLVALVDFFKSDIAPVAPSKVYLIGASMGALIATQLAEGQAGVFDGAMAVCGLSGDFKRQLTYWGNFNVLYRTFFSNVVASWNPQPGATTTKTQWETLYQPSIIAGITTNMTATQGLLSTAKAAIDPGDPTSAVTTVLGLAYFSFLSSEDAALRLGGNPFENRTTWYRGLPTFTDTMALNKAVPRLAASPAAVAAMASYETTGKPTIPLVVMHTTLDPIAPVDQTLLYILKARAVNNTNVTPYLVQRYGHCTFTPQEVVGAFSVLVAKVLGQDPPAQLPPTLIRDQALEVIVQAFAASEAIPDPLSFNQLRLPSVLQGNPQESAEE